MSKYPKIEVFPDDQKQRVVLLYGPVFTKESSNSKTLLVKVLTRQLLDDNTLTKQVQSYDITVTELDIVRIGTIWEGRKRLDGLYTALKHYRHDFIYTFDFTISQPESIPFGTKRDATNEPNKWLIPPFIYDLGDLKKNKALMVEFFKSTLTKLVATNGTTVLIPSLEFLTSAISPEHKLLRTNLLHKGIDVICSDYMNKGYEKDGTYVIETKKGYFKSNLTLLAYMRNNHVSRSRLSQIYSFVGAENKYPEKYPSILPYHPTGMTLQGDGIMINDNTFLASGMGTLKISSKKTKSKMPRFSICSLISATIFSAERRRILFPNS